MSVIHIVFHGTLQIFGGFISGLLGIGSFGLFTLPVHPTYLLGREEFLHAFSSPRIEILLHLMEILSGFSCIEMTVVVLFKRKRWLLSSCTFWDLSPVRGGFPFLQQLSVQRRISWVLLPSEMSSDVFLVYPLCSSNCFEKA